VSVIVARAVRWRPLCAGVMAGVVFAAASGVASGATPGGAPAASPARACNPAWCALSQPTPAEFAAIVAEADRLLARYADDSTALGRECRTLGATMKTRVGDVRMIDYMWRTEDPDGHVAPVTGDAHPREAVAGTGVVHIARGYDALNPDRGLPAILQTARHEFAHLNGSRQSEGGVDVAAQLAVACGPP